MKLNELCILRNHYLEQVETLMREVGLSTTIAEKNQKIKLATEYTKRIGELDTMTKRILLKETKTKQIEEILKSIMNKIKTLFKKK